MTITSQLPKFLIRLPRNLMSNRWYLIFQGRLYIYSRGHQRQLSLEHLPGLARGKTSGLRVFVLPWALLVHPKNIPSSHIGFVLPHLGRFGNAVREVVSATASAHRHKFGHVVLLGFSLFSQSGELSNPGFFETQSGLKVWIEKAKKPGRSRPSALVHWDRRLFSPPISDPDRAWAESRSFLVPGLVGRRSGPNTLVIHLRGGDIFRGRAALEYAQPPLAFYTLVLSLRKWDKVSIVHQDKQNPVLEPLIRHCDSQGVPVTLNSGGLVDDLKVLLGSATLVAGRGTFIPAVVGLSKRVKTVYFFENKYVVTPAKSGVKTIQVVDHQGTYKSALLQSNWSSSAHQLELMVSYPQANLAIGKVTIS